MIKQLSDDFILVIDAMFRDIAYHVVPDKVRTIYDLMRCRYERERKERGLSAIDVTDNIKPREFDLDYEREEEREKEMDGFGELLKGHPNEEISIWYALGAEVLDFSYLGRWIRDYADAIGFGAAKELNERGIDLEFFCDMI